MQATGTFTRRATSAETIRARLDAARDTLARAAAGHDHDHPQHMWHALLVEHLNAEHGQSLALTGNDGMGTRDLTEAHERAHELTREGCQDAGEHDGPSFDFGARIICKRHAIERGIY